MLISAASAADADIAVSDAPSIDQVTINQNEVTYNDSSAKSLNAVPTGDISVNAEKKDTKLSYTEDYSYNETTGLFDATITVTLTKSGSGRNAIYPTGTITITTAGGESFSKVITQGKYAAIGGGTDSTAKVVISGLQVGDNIVTVNYSSDDNFNGLTESHTFTVTLKDPGLDFYSVPKEVYRGNDVNFTAKLASDAIGDVYFSIDGGEWQVGTNSTRAKGYVIYTLETSGMELGTHTVDIKYDGYGIYKNDSANNTFTVTLKDPGLDFNSFQDEVYRGNDIKFTAQLASDAIGDVYFSIDGGEWQVGTNSSTTSTKRQVTYTLGTSGLELGTHTVAIKYDGYGIYKSSNKTKNFDVIAKIDPNITVTNLESFYYLDETLSVRAIINALISGKLSDAPVTNVSFRIDNGEMITKDVIYTSTGSWIKTVTNAYADFSHDVSDLSVGDHNLTVKFDGTNVLDTYEHTFTFTVKEVDKKDIKNITIDVSPLEIYDGKVTVTSTVVFEDEFIKGDGNVSVLVNGIVKDTKALDDSNSVVFNLNGLSKGENNISVIFNGNRNYNPKESENVSVNVIKQPTIAISGVSDTVYDDKVEVTVTVTGSGSRPTGSISFSIDGGVNWVNKTLSRSSSSSSDVSYTFTGLAKGDYTVLVRYNGDENYDPVGTNKTFKVDRYSAPTLTISDVSDIVYDDKVTAKVKATIDGSDHAEGIISFSLDGVNWFNETLTYRSSSGATASYQFTNLAKGNYNLLVKYIGGNCEPAEANTTFKVDRYDPQVNVTGLNDIYYPDETLSVRASLDKDVTGNVSFRIDNGTWTDKPIQYDYLVVIKVGAYADFSTAIAGLTVGDHNLTVKYNGDNQFDSYEHTFAFTVALRDPNMVVSDVPGSIVSGSNLTVDVTLDSKATGTVSFILDGVEYNATVSGGKANYTFNNTVLTKGDHNLTVVYSGDSIYDGDISDLITFNVVSKTSETNITINKDSIVYGESVNVTAIVTDGATGTVTLLVDGEEWSTKNLTGNTYVFDLSLDAGEYNITVRYNGDDNFAASESDIKVLTVNKAEINNITINVVPTVTDDGKVTVTATVIFEDGYVNGVALGNVSVLVDGKVKDTKDLNAFNVAEFNLTGLTRGEYNIAVRFNGNDNYNSKKSENVTVNVLKKPTLSISLISIYLSDGTLYDDEVTVSVLALGNPITTVPKGTIFFSIDGGNTWANDTLSVAGTASYTFNSLSKGNYTVLVKYIGSNYDPTEANKTFEVSRYETTLTVTTSSNNITVGDNTLVTIIVADDKLLSIPTGKVYYSLDNNTWTEATMDIPFSFGSNLTEGNYTIYAKYDGDSHHFGSTGTTTLKVVRKSLDLAIDVEDCALDEDLVVKATTDKGFTGNLTFDVNGTVQSVEVVNGSANATFSGLGIGSYLVIVKYDGDILYAPDSVNKTISVKSGKLNITASLNTTSIREIDSVKVTATLSESVTGNVSVLVDGNVINTTEIPNGATNVEFILSNLTKGTYNISVRYEGNEYYISKKSENVVLNVTRAPVKPNVDISIDGTLDILPIINSNTVTIIVDLAYDNEPVLGNVRFSLDNGTTWTDYVSLKNKTSGIIFKQHCGEANYTFSDLEDGTHTVLVEYEGSYDYLPTNGTKTFQTVRYETSITVTTVSIDSKPLDKEIPVGNTAYALVLVNHILGLSSVTGNISYSFDNETWNTTPVLLNGVLIPLKDLKVGNYTLYVSYPGDNKYQGSNGTMNFSIIKRDANWVITVNPINLDRLFDLSLEDLFNGTLLSILNRSSDKDILSIILDSIINKDLEYGDIPIVTVTDVDPQLVLGIPAPTGTISFSLDGNKWYTEKVLDLLNVPTASHIFALLGLDQLVLDAGNYTVYINYSGDDNYNAFNTTKDFTIKKVNPDISIIMTPESIIPGEGALFTVTLDGNKLTQVKNPKGNVSFSIDGGEWIDENILSLLINSYSAHTFTNISEGNHTVTIRYNGDNNYNVVYANKTFEVNRVVPTLEIDVDDVIIGPVVDVRATLDDSKLLYEPTGNVSFKLDNGTWFTVPLTKIILDPHADYTFNGVSVGNHTVFVRYNGDVHFAPIEANKTFEVTKAVPTLNIDVDDVTIGPNVDVRATLDDSKLLYEPTGNVSFKVDGGEWVTVPLTKIILDPHADYTFTGLSVGNHTVFVRYNGDDYFFPVEGNKTFEVTKITPTLNINVDDVTIGPNVDVSASLDDSYLLYEPTGNVSFKVDDGEWVTVDLIKRALLDPYASTSFEGLEVGNHTLFVRYNGDDYFFPVEGNKTFEVTKITPTLNIDVDNITYGEDATVIVSLDDSYLLYEPTGNVSFKLGENGEWITVPLTKIIVLNPFASHTYEDLAAGDYTVYVKYNGDDYFFPVEDSAKFTVERANPKLSIETENIVYGNNATIVATLPNNAEGTVTFILSNGDNVTVPVINGSAIAVFEGLGAKRYNVTAIYSGDNNYTNASVSDDFEVYKAIPDVSANVSDIHYRENATVVVTVPSDATGIVYATVDGKNWYNATINNGKANIIIPGLTGGNYTAFVLYTGDDNYTWAFTSDEFKVIRINPDINVSVNDITYGEDATVVVTMANDATGNLTIALSNGMNKTVEIINGTANATFSGLGADYYFLKVSYPGDNNYWGMTDVTGFNVSQADPNISVAVDNITYGNNATVVVTVPSDATGTVTVVLDNGMNQTVDVVNGTATAVFEDLGAGDYIVSVTYSGDQNYTGDDTTTVFTVEQATPDVTISVDNVTYGEDATVFVTVTGVDGNPVTGNVTFFFDTEEITVELDENGTASYTFSGLGAGTYDGNVRYNGNDNYTYVLDQFEFTVYKADPTIYVDVGPNKPIMTEIIEGDDVIVIVTLPEDATGIVGFSLDGGKTWVYADVINGTAKYVFKGLKAGEYNLLVRYFGDENYNPADVNTTFVVEALPAPESPLTTMPNTGNPLLVLLIALAGLGLGSLKRKL